MVPVKQTRIGYRVFFNDFFDNEWMARAKRYGSSHQCD